MRLVLIIACIILSLFSGSCAPIVKVSGYVPLKTEVDQLSIGVSTKAETLKTLGRPLSYGNSSSNSLLYIQQKVATVAFFKPRVFDRKVVEFNFDDSDILSGFDYFTGLETSSFNPEKKIVAAKGRKITFWQQIFGNIGNFSTDQFLD